MPDDDRLYSALLYFVFVGGLVIYFWGIWAIPTLSHNEARRMIVVQEMISNHNWLIPTLNGQPYLAKPPLFYWLAALLSLLFHTTDEWVMRLPSALSAFAVTWFLFVRVKEYISPWVALWTALTLITSSEFTMFARRAEIEMLLAACCATSLILYLDYLKKQYDSKYLYLSYFFLALAFLTKGPVALLFFVPPIVVFGLLQKDRKALKGLISVRGWAIFAVVALPWYGYAFFNLETRMEKVVSKDIISKALSQEHKDPFYDYILVLLGAFAPWIIALCYKTKKVCQHIHNRYETAYFACGFLVPLIIMSFIATKHPKYILPLIPCGAVVIGIWLAELAASLEILWPAKYHFRMVSVVGAVVVGFFLYYSLVEAQIYKYRYEALNPLVAKLKTYGEGNRVYLYKDLNYRVVYYYGEPIPVVQKAKLHDMIENGGSFLLIAESSSWGDLTAEKLCVVAEYKPFLKRDRAVRILATNNLCPPS